MDIRLSFTFDHGKPGAGKDSQADRLVELLPNSMKISTGDFYRDAKAGSKGKYSRFRDILAPYVDSIDKGGFIPDEIVVDLVHTVVTEAISSGTRNFVFTGFPRTKDQLILVDEMLQELREGYIVEDRHILYALTDELSKDRAKTRREKAQNVGELPRKDDEEETVGRRLLQFKEKTLPMIETLNSEGRLIVIRGNRSKETVFETTSGLLRERV